MARRTIVYIDGFNLYYGAVKGTPHKWLNLQKYFTLLIPDDDLREICYFTAEVSGAPLRRPAGIPCRTCHPAADLDPLRKVKEKLAKCAGNMHAGNRWFSVMEEKRTDVNIAVRLVEDAYEDACDKFVIVSGRNSGLGSAAPQFDVVSRQACRVVYIPALDPTHGATLKWGRLRTATDCCRLT